MHTHKELQEIAKKDNGVIAAMKLLDLDEGNPELRATKKAIYIELFISGYIFAIKGEE